MMLISVGLMSSAIASALATPMTDVPIWPIPELYSCSGQSSTALFNSNVTLSFAGHTPSPVAEDALARYQALLRASGASDGRVVALLVDVIESDEDLSLDTDYSYALDLDVAASASTCPRDHPWAYRPQHNFDYCCASGDDCYGHAGINSLSDRSLRAECCKGGADVPCGSPPCLDNGVQQMSVTAASPYAVVHAMESLLQLAEQNCSSFRVQDKPAFPHRGLMVDTGRRFYPMPLLQNLIEGMAMMKMNVLHFHLGEQCWRVESKVFPELHKQDCAAGNAAGNYTYHNNEYYTHEDIATLVRFAQLRGVRVVPEVDSPGHSGGLCKGLQSRGLNCCASRAGPMSQVADDADGKGFALVSEAIREVSGLFPDAVFHVGADETSSCKGFGSTRVYEEKLIAFVQGLGKTVMGWNEIISGTKAAEAFPKVIIEEWGKGSNWQRSARLGRRVVESHYSDFYLDSAKWSAAQMWKDLYISTQGGDGHVNANASERALLLGAETAMWSDQYVPPKTTNVVCMFQSPVFDANFSTSTSAMIWPRAAVAAGSFYRFNASLTNSSDTFAQLLKDINRRLTARGVEVCQCTTPSHQGCTQASRCGVYYCPKPFPPHHSMEGTLV